MEIQNGEILLSYRDIIYATMGHEAVNDRDFSDYLHSLNNKLDRIVPLEEQASGTGDNVHLLRIPYSKKAAEMLGTVIFAGQRISIETEPLLQTMAAQLPYEAAVNRARYTADARRQAKSRFRVIKND